MPWGTALECTDGIVLVPVRALRPCYVENSLSKMLPAFGNFKDTAADYNIISNRPLDDACLLIATIIFAM